MKIKLKGHTKFGLSNFTLFNPKQAAEDIKPLDGDIIITIERVDGDTTDAQIHHFRTVVLPAFISESNKMGNDYFSEEQAEMFLLQQYAGVNSIEDIIENGKNDFSVFIDKCKAFIREFFRTQII